MKVVSLYARVSSEKQAQERTIESQVAELERRISEDEHELLDEYKFIDNGYSGANLERPGLDRLRDKVKEGKIDKIYIHSPDRLSRKAVYQIILLDEFEKAGVEVIFLNCKADNSPESNLLLQMQGAIAEYERAKIIERNRRGRLHAARKGRVSVMSGAPYGYRYIKRGEIGKEGKFEINEEEAEVVKKLFTWIGEERVNLKEAVRRLKKMSIRTRTGKEMWCRSTITGILKNPAYKGKAAFGRSKIGSVKPAIRPRRNAAKLQKYSVTCTDKENWIYVSVPKIVDEKLFDIVQERMEENRQRARKQKKGQNLLQGLVVCKRCRYAYCGISNKVFLTCYYFCSGTRNESGRKVCDNKRVHADVLEMNVWKKVKSVLRKSEKLIGEYQSRLSGNKEAPLNQDIERQENKLKQRISKLIDSYTNEYINIEEFESRITEMRKRLKEVEEEKEKVKDQEMVEQEFAIIVSRIKKFASDIESEIDQYSRLEKRSVIKKLVKRIEINVDDIIVVFRIKEFVAQNRENQNMQYCSRVQKRGLQEL